MKHTRIYRIAALLLAALMLTLALVSCANPLKPTEDDLRVVATCEGYEVCYDEFRYIVLAFRDEYTARYGDDVFTDSTKAAAYLPALRADVENAMKINAAIFSLCADFGISPEDEDIANEVDAQVESAIESAGGKKEYADLLASAYMTDHFVRSTLAADLCESALCRSLVSLELVISNELDFMEYALDDRNMCATYHIFIGNDEGENVEQNRARAEEVLTMIENGTKLTDLIGSAYNEDNFPPSSPYHFMKTEYDEAYERAAFALEIGEVSGVVETDDGFYVIERQPIKESYVVANLTELFQRYQYIQVETLLADHREALTLTWSDFGAGLDLLALQ